MIRDDGWRRVLNQQRQPLVNRNILGKLVRDKNINRDDNEREMIINYIIAKD
jgi:hypothetical protein